MTVENGARRFQVARLDPVMLLDRRDLGRMDGGLADHAVRQVFDDFLVQQLGQVEGGRAGVLDVAADILRAATPLRLLVDLAADEGPRRCARVVVCHRLGAFLALGRSLFKGGRALSVELLRSVRGIVDQAREEIDGRVNTTLAK